MANGCRHSSLHSMAVFMHMSTPVRTAALSWTGKRGMCSMNQVDTSFVQLMARSSSQIRGDAWVDLAKVRD
jgi:hypothetical protein